MKHFMSFNIKTSNCFYSYFFIVISLLLSIESKSQIAVWNFFNTNSPTTFAATNFNANLVSTNGANNITRGSGATSSTGNYSFRTTGFKIQTISTSSNSYFQITLTAATGYKVSLTSIDANFSGTASFYATPGVSSQFAYSLDGANFTLISPVIISTTTSLTMPQINLSGISTLQNVAAGTTITLRYYASGQTTTGGWGFYSVNTNTNGLVIGGTVNSCTIPSVNTVNPPTSITPTSSTFVGNVTATGGAAITGNGVVYCLSSLTTTPVYGSSYVTTLQTSYPGVGISSFSDTTAVLLSPNTSYNYNVFATNSVGTSNGTSATFYTLCNTPTSPTINGATTSTLDITINPNANPPATLYAIRENIINYITPLYVQHSNGQLGTDIDYQTPAKWGINNKTTVSGLSANSTYGFSISAQNQSGINTIFSSYTSSNTSSITTPTISASGTLTSMNTTYGSPSALPISFSVSGIAMSSGIVVTPPAGFEVSTSFTFFSNVGNHTSPITVGSPGIIGVTNIYLRLQGFTSVGTYSGNIVLNSNGATQVDIPTASSTVTSAFISIIGLTGVNKLYDGTTSATTAGTPVYSGLMNSEIFTVRGSPNNNFIDESAGINKEINTAGYLAPSENYTVTQPTLRATIIQDTLIIVNARANDKTYDGNTSVIVFGTITGVLNGDIGNVTFNDNFSDVNVANNIAINFALTGTKSCNYTLTNPNISASILSACQTINFTQFTTSITSLISSFPLVSSSTSGLMITYSSSNLSVASISGNTVSIVGSGTCIITANQLGNNNYLAAPSISQTLIVSTPSIIYQSNFDDNSVNSTNYNPYVSNPVSTSGILDPNLSNSTWSSNSSFIGAIGNNSTGCLASNITSNPFILTFSVTQGYQLSITSFSFWTRASISATWSMKINGISVGSGSASTNTNGANTGLINVSNAINGLTGTITVILNLGGSGSFRLDDFTLSGTVKCSNNNPPIIITHSLEQSICYGSALKINVNAINIYNYQWKLNGANIINATNASYSVPLCSSNDGGNYSVLVSGALCSLISDDITVVIKPIPDDIVITPSSASICNGSNINLVASGGTIFVRSILGTKASQNSSISYPASFSMYYGGQRMQFLILASELSTMGLKNGSIINSIGFPVVSLGSNWNATTNSCNNFKIKLGLTVLNSLSAFIGGLATYFGPLNFTPVVGNGTANLMIFNNGIIWDGISNLIIETTFSNNITGKNSDAVVQYFTTSSFNSMIQARADSVTSNVMEYTTIINYGPNCNRPDIVLNSTLASNLTWVPPLCIDTISGLFTKAAPLTSQDYIVTSNINGCTNNNKISIIVNDKTWIGAINSDWTNPDNWCGGVPAANENVTIPSGTISKVILTTDVILGDVNSNDTIYINGQNLTINGNIKLTTILSGSQKSSLMLGQGAKGFLTFNSKTDSITNALKNLTFNSSSIQLINSLHIYGNMNIKSGIFDLANKNLILHSNFTNTASIDRLGLGYGNIINSGNVSIQRYIKDRRAWVLMTAPLTTNKAVLGLNGDIKNNWQSYTQIFGAGGTSLGLDQGPNSNACMKYWNGIEWIGITNTISNNSLFGNYGSDSAANKTFFLFMRGNRSIPAYGITGHSSDSLMATGSLQMGNKILKSVGIKYGLISNPYPAPIDLNSFYNYNYSIGSTFYYWNSSMNTLGAYVTCTNLGNGKFNTVPGTSGINVFIQSGQGFFIVPKTVADSNTTVAFTESMKNVNNSSNINFGSSNQNDLSIFTINLNSYDSTGTKHEVDGVGEMFNSNYSNDVDIINEDIIKLYNNGENLCILRKNNYLAIEKRSDLKVTDTIFFYLSGLQANTNYQFEFNPYNLSTFGLIGYLIDNYLVTKTAIDLSKIIPISFTIDSCDASKDVSRFKIIFDATKPLMVNGFTLTAYFKANAIIVDWKVIEEKDLEYFQLERSKDDNSFVLVANIIANNKNNNNYSYTDNNNLTDTNYYRIKAISKDGNVQFSKKVKVIKGSTKGVFFVFPNPIIGNVINLVINNLDAGNYNLSMYNSRSQLIINKSIKLVDGNITTKVQLPANLASGIYQILLTGIYKTYKETVIVK